MKTRAAIAKDARWLRSGLQSPLKVEQGDGERPVIGVGKANKQTVTATGSPKRLKPDTLPRTRTPKLLEPPDDASRPGCSGTSVLPLSSRKPVSEASSARRSGTETPAGTSRVSFHDTTQATSELDKDSPSRVSKVRKGVEQIVESSNVAEKKSSPIDGQRAETMGDVREKIATEVWPQSTQSKKRGHKQRRRELRTSSTSSQDSPECVPGHKGGRSVVRKARGNTAPVPARTKLRITAKIFGRHGGVQMEAPSGTPTSRAAGRETPARLEAKTGEIPKVEGDTSVCEARDGSERKIGEVANGDAATDDEGAGPGPEDRPPDGGTQSGAEIEVATPSLDPEGDEAVGKIVDRAENAASSLLRESEELRRPAEHGSRETGKSVHADDGVKEAKDSRSGTQKFAEEAERRGEAEGREIGGGTGSGVQSSGSLDKNGRGQTPEAPAGSATIVERRQSAEKSERNGQKPRGKALPDSATEENFSGAANDEAAKRRLQTEGGRRAGESSEGLGDRAEKKPPPSEVAKEPVAGCSGEPGPSSRRRARGEVAQVPSEASDGESPGNLARVRKRSGSKKKASGRRESEPSPALPKRRRIAVRTSLSSSAKKRPSRDVEAARDDPSASSRRAEEDGGSSDGSAAAPSRGPRGPRKKRPKEERAERPSGEEAPPGATVRRRDVATQVVTEGTSSSAWFEFYGAEPTVRHKALKRNHYSQTNARTIAELDYERCASEPVVKAKYLCGVESCTYKSTVTDLIAHVKGRHASYKRLVCKRCRREHESLALFVCHLGSKGCPWNTSDEEDERSASSGGEDAGWDDDPPGSGAKESEPTEVGDDAQPPPCDGVAGARSEAPVPSARSASESLVVVLASDSNFLRAVLLPQNVALFSLKKVGRLLKAGTEYTRISFRSDPLLDAAYVGAPSRLDKVDGGALTPGALYRTVAPRLAPEQRARLTSALQRLWHRHGRLTKSVVESLSAFRARLDAKTVETAPVLGEPPPLPSPGVESEIIWEAPRPAASTAPEAGVPEEPSGCGTVCSDLLQRAVESLSCRESLSSPSADAASRSPPATDRTEASYPTAEMGGEVARACQQLLLSSTAQASGVPQSGGISYVIPVVLDGKYRSFASYVMPTADVNRMLLPLVTGVPQQPSYPGGPIGAPRLPGDASGKFPKLMPKVSSPYRLRTPTRQPARRRKRRSLLAFPAVPNGSPLPSHVGGPATPTPTPPGTVPKFPRTPSTLFAPASGVQRSGGAVPAAQNADAPQTSAIKAAPVTSGPPPPANLREKGVQSPTKVSGSPDVVKTGTQPAAATTSSLQKYRDVFQAALERAVKVSEMSAKRSVPSKEEAVPRGRVVGTGGGTPEHAYACECGFRSRSKNTLEQHIRERHIAEGHVCLVCSIKFSGLGELEQHFLKHVKVVKWDVAPETPAHASTGSEEPESVATVPRRPQASSCAGPSRPRSRDCTSPSLLQEVLGKPNILRARAATESSNCEVVEVDSSSTDTPPRGARSASSPEKGREAVVIDIDSSDAECAAPKSAPEDGRRRDSAPLGALRPDLAGSEAAKPFFKCVIGDCKVTSDSAMEFSIHLTSHSCKDLLNLRCIYCESTFDAINAMVSHMTEKHGRRVYQCGWCLYRAAAKASLTLHLRFSHADREALFYECGPADFADDGPLPEKVETTEYRCGVTGCNFQSFSASCFERHYETGHEGTTRYPCSACDVVLETVDALVEHWIVHGVNAVQCAYCRHGTATFPEMLRHLADSHADDRQFNFYIRTAREQREFRAFVDRADNQAIFAPDAPSTPDEVREGAVVVAAEVRPTAAAGASTKPCPFCGATVAKVSDVVRHCSEEHKIALPLSTVLDLLLKKATAGKLRAARSSCPFCDYEGDDCDELKEHLYEEFGYAPYRCGACDSELADVRRATAHFAVAHPSAECRLVPERNSDFERWVDGLVGERRRAPEKIERAFLCVQCDARFDRMFELRTHLYSHKKYFPHQCAICAESFTTAGEAEQHQRDQHKVSTPYLVEQVRLAAVEQVVEESLEAQVDAIRERIRASPTEYCLWEGCNYHSSERLTLLEHMDGVHVGVRHACASCSFASYCEEVVAWHAKTAHRVPMESAEVIVESPAVVAHKPRGTFKCCYCKFRANSSIAIREHAATSHRGLPVKMVAPPRPTADYCGPVQVTAVRSGPAPELPPERTAKRPRSVRSVDPRTASHRGGRRVRCRRCSYSAPSARLLNIHWSNLHRSGSEDDEGGAAAPPAAEDASVSSTTLDLVDDLARPSTSKAAFDRTPPSRLYQSKLLSSGGTLGLGSKSSTAAHTCSRCSARFDTKSDLACHRSERHHYCAVCVYCEKEFTNEKQALSHCTKHHPALAPKYRSTAGNRSRAVEARAAKSGQKEDSEGFSWYGREREPVDLDALYVQAVVPSFGKPMRLTAATFLTVRGRRPVLRIKDFTKHL